MSHLTVQDLSASLDGTLTGPALEKAVSHLSGCHECSETQARLARNDELLRGLFAFDPDARRLDELARRSEALVTSIIRGLPVPPITPVSTPMSQEVRTEQPPTARADAAKATTRKDSGTVERFARFRPPGAAARDAEATPANGGDLLPPPREPSRAMTRPGTSSASPDAPLDVTPRFDMDRTPDAESDAKPGTKPAHSLVESYDAFNDRAYDGPGSGGRMPPMLGRPPEKPADADGQPAKREYRHGGVRRDGPDGTAPASDTPARGSRRQQPMPRDDGFGVRRTEGPAWSRLGLEPDPSSPGMFRETLTGASVAPPPVGSRHRGASRGSKTGPIMALLVVGGLVAVFFAMRMPTANHLLLQLGRGKASTSSPPTASSPGLAVHEATTQPPVDVAVPSQAAGGQAVSAQPPQLCGRVLDKKGRPIAGVLFTVASTLAQVRSDDAGRFCLAAPAGEQVVDLVDPRGAGTAARQMRMNFVPGAPEARIVLP